MYWLMTLLSLKAAITIHRNGASTAVLAMASSTNRPYDSACRGRRGLRANRTRKIAASAARKICAPFIRRPRSLRHQARHADLHQADHEDDEGHHPAHGRPE